MRVPIIYIYLFYMYYVGTRLIYVSAAPAARVKFRRPKTIEKPITTAAPVDDSRVVVAVAYTLYYIIYI